MKKIFVSLFCFLTLLFNPFSLFNLERSSPTKRISPRPGGPGNTTVTSFLPFSVSIGIRIVPRTLVRLGRAIAVSRKLPTSTPEGRICVGGRGGCPLASSATVNVSLSPAKLLPGMVRMPPDTPPPLDALAPVSTTCQIGSATVF